ncbi:MAG: hypothetical protein HZC36_03180 [Armatimonadetes bacterium]|nr:hypothetical protein [Armatimonadota bacterium]
MATLSVFASRLMALIVGLVVCVGLLAAGISREVPRGGLDGKVVMSENGRPLSDLRIILREENPYDWDTLERLPDEDKPKSYVEWTDDEGRFTFRNVKAGNYEIETYAVAHELKPVKFAITEGKAQQLDLEMKPVAPYLNLYSNQHVFRTDEKVQVQLHGFSPEEQIRFTVTQLKMEMLPAKGALYNAIGGLKRQEAAARSMLGAQVRQVTKPISERTPEGTFEQFFDLGDLSEGDYFVECQVGALRTSTWINVSRIAMVAKTWDSGALCFVTDIKTGSPISGAAIYAPKGGRFELAAKSGPDGRASIALKGPSDNSMLLARQGKSTAIVGFYASGGEGDGSHRLSLYTDRPIYRPGDEVQFKGVVRQLSGARYALSKAKEVQIEIRDSSETLIQKQTLAVNAMGSFSGHFATSKEAEPGVYGIRTQIGEEKLPTKWVSIAAYRKPEISLTVKPEKPSYQRGDKVRFLVEAKYFYGSPVAGAEVTANIGRSPHWEWFGVDAEEADEYEEYNDSYGHREMGGEYLSELKATTDSEGRAVIEVDTSDEEQFGPQDWTQADSMDLTAYVSLNDGDKYADATAKTQLSQGLVRLHVDTPSTLAEPRKPIEVAVQAAESYGGKPSAGLRVKLVAGYEVWTGIESVFKVQDTLFATTGSDGRARFQITPKHSGDMSLRAEAQDTRGNTIRTSEWMWLYGGASDDLGSPRQELQLQLEKSQFKVGESVRCLIVSEGTGQSALVTVEGDRVYSSQVVQLANKVTEVQAPVLEEHRPNVFVSVCFVSNKRLLQTERRLKIDLAQRTLGIAISTDKQVYKPGDKATYTVRTTGPDGRPMPAEVSLGVVDEAIYAMAADTTDLLRDFYPKRYNSVQTSYSFEEVYLDGGDKAPGDIQIREVFKDTAYWNPAIQTNAQGLATVTLQLPDNLTTWRATAVGVTSTTEVGMGVAKVRAKKDLMVRLQVPAYLVQGDSQRLLAMVTNDTDRDQNVNVQLDSPPLPVRGDLRQSVHVPAGETRPVEWVLSTPEAGWKTLTAKAWTDSASDGERKTFEIRPHGREFVSTAAGEVRGSASFLASVRPGADPNTGRLKITLSPTLASAVVQSLGELIDFPYGCVEQTMSRLLPTVVVSKALQDSGLPPIPQLKRVPAIVSDGFTRLKAMRHDDGAWGWWEHDDSNTFMTSLVLEGLHHAAEAGYPAQGIDTKRALDWLAQAVMSPFRDGRDWWYFDDVTSRLYANYVLALYGRDKEALQGLAYVPIKDMGPYETSLLALTYGALGKGYEKLHADALKVLVGQAIEANGVARWPERYWGEEAGARCLLALASAQPNHPLIPKVVRGLMLSRKGDMWTSTRDTSYVVVALTKWWRATGGASPTGSVSVKVNGAIVQTLQLTASSIIEPDLQITVPMAQLRAGDNRVEIASTGSVCYYSSEMKQTVIEKNLAPVSTDPGFSVQRELYLMSAQLQDDGRYRVAPGKHPVTIASRGDVLECQVTIKNAKAMQFVILEIPIPSNCDATARTEIDRWEEWSYDFDQLQISDNKAALFLRRLEPGEHTYKFTLRAQAPGASSALPVSAYNMYDPTVRAYSAETPLEVRGR